MLNCAITTQNCSKYLHVVVGLHTVYESTRVRCGTVMCVCIPIIMGSVGWTVSSEPCTCIYIHIYILSDYTRNRLAMDYKSLGIELITSYFEHLAQGCRLLMRLLKVHLHRCIVIMLVSCHRSSHMVDDFATL